MDAGEAKPIGLARVALVNGNLAPELGDDSDAVTWPDGRAVLSHKFFIWEERQGDQISQRQFVQGPWIHVSADGYEPLKKPLSELLGKVAAVLGPSEETVVNLRAQTSRGPRLGGPGR